jgi:hypothetical protein
MSPFTRCLAGVLLGLGVASALPQHSQASEDAPREFLLKYRLLPTISQEFYTSGQSLAALRDKPPLKEEPTYRSRQPIYRILRLGVKEQCFTVVLDSSRGEARGYDTLHVDADGDGRITPAEKWTGVPSGSSMTFGPVKFLVDCGAEKCPQWFLFSLSESEDADRRVICYLHAVNAGHYTGTVRFGAEKRQLAILDGNANGLYNDVFHVEDETPDRLLLDGDGAGKLDGSHPSDRAQPLTRWVEVGGRYWHLDVAPDGSQVTVRPLNKPLGTLRLKVDTFTLLLRGPDGLLQVRGREGKAQLPAGKYRLLQGEYRVSRDGAADWRFAAHADDAPFYIDVPPEGIVQVPFGPPLVAEVRITRSGLDLILDLKLRGTGGELYNDVSSGKHGRPPVPRLEIRDAAGRKLDSLDFHYG